MKRPIRDKLKDKEKPGIDQLKKAAIKSIKGILAGIKRNYEITMNITCIIAGVGTIATFEYLKEEIEEEAEEEDAEEKESTRKIVEMLKKKLEKAKERIIKTIMAKNLSILTFTASTESIPYISWITNVNIETTIRLVD